METNGGRVGLARLTCQFLCEKALGNPLTDYLKKNEGMKMSRCARFMI